MYTRSSIKRYCSFFAAAALALWLVSCSSKPTLEDNPLAVQQLFDTAVQTTPVDAQTRDNLQKQADEELLKTTIPLEQGLNELKAKRAAAYAAYKQEFPDCQSQKHCLSILVNGDVKRFERFQELNRSILAYDRPIVERSTSIMVAKRKHSLFLRWVYNRYLAHEILSMDLSNTRIAAVRVYGLESFSSRQQISKRLFRYLDTSYMRSNLLDYDFRLHRKAIDEGALLLTLEVQLMPARPTDSEPNPKATGPYYVTMLLNSTVTDPSYYDSPFRRALIQLLDAEGLPRLSAKASCGLFAIASETLLPRISVNNYFLCEAYREAMQAPVVNGLEAVEESIVPLSFLPGKQI